MSAFTVLSSVVFFIYYMDLSLFVNIINTYVHMDIKLFFFLFFSDRKVTVQSKFTRY